MDRNEVIALIERYAIENNLKPTDFAVAGDAAKFLLGDSLQFIGAIELAFRTTFCQAVPPQFEGQAFCCYKHHGKWASYKPSEHSAKFVISTYHRLPSK